MGKSTFVIGSAWAARLLNVSNEDFAIIVKAVFQYAVTGDAPEVSGLHGAVVSEMTEFIAENNERYEEVCRKRREAGALGGKQKVANAKQMVANAKQMGSKNKQNGYDNDNDNDNEYDNDNEPLKERAVKREHANACKREPRHKYGQYNNVLLSDDDLAKLQTEFPTDWQNRIERLSEYIESKGAKYKNHLATIRAWARKDKPKQQDGKPYAFAVIDNMDWEGIQ